MRQPEQKQKNRPSLLLKRETIRLLEVPSALEFGGIIRSNTTSGTTF